MQGLQIKYSVTGQAPQTIPLRNFPIIIGTLLSNQIVVRAAGVEPIHAILEEENGRISITDLGSVSGVIVNGTKIEVSKDLNVGDKIEIGGGLLEIEQFQIPVVAAPEIAGLPKPPGQVIPPMPPVAGAPSTYEPPVQVDTAKAGANDEQRQTVRQEPGANDQRKEKKDLLFSPRKARPSGDVLEVVAYWDDTILDVDLFHPSFKDYNQVSIGDPTKAHFIAAGESDVSKHVLATIGSGGYKIRLLPGMEARMRKGGQVMSAEGPGSHRMGARDIAHIKYGPIRYFLLFVNPPVIDMPRSGVRDPILSMLTLVATVLYLVAMPMLWMTKPKDLKKDKDDVWALVQLPKKEEPPKPETPPVKKEVVKIEEVKTEPPVKRPPPPQPKPVKQAKPEEVEKPKQTKPVEVPKQAPQKTEATENLKKQAPPTPTPATKPAQTAQTNDSKQQGGGMASTGAKNPDFKKAGPRTNNNSPKSGGAQGSGMNQQGGERKGNKAVSTMGVEGPKNDQASGVNLSKLGLGVGKILNQTAPGAINTNFKNSAGGAGGGSGSGSRTYGFGGVGNSGSLGLAGSGSAVNNFGSGSGGFGSGQGGTGGLGGAGIGKGFGDGDGRGRANVTVPSAGPVVSGGLTRQEILAVIQTNLNQIRHCYEQLLQRSPSASGKITVKFSIGASGGVTTVGIDESTISDSVMRGCVTGRIQRWQFPKPRGASSVDVVYPFVFTPL